MSLPEYVLIAVIAVPAAVFWAYRWWLRRRALQLEGRVNTLLEGRNIQTLDFFRPGRLKKKLPLGLLLNQIELRVRRLKSGDVETAPTPDESNRPDESDNPYAPPASSPGRATVASDLTRYASPSRRIAALREQIETLEQLERRDFSSLPGLEPP